MPSISKLPAAPTAPPDLLRNTVALYQDASWSSKSYLFNVNDYTKDQRHSISGTNLQDKATWIAFNLPEGTVVTMMNNTAAPPEGNVYNLKNCGSVVDLVGTGRTESVALSLCNMNDCISGWYWHTPDMHLGGVELYQDADFKGNRTVLFLSEWPAKTPTSLAGWYIADRASSVRWQSLCDAQMVQLFQHSDGSGKAYNNVKGWGSFKELPSLATVGLSDAVSSFSWNNLFPKKEIIEPKAIDAPSPGNLAYMQTMDGRNNNAGVQEHVITLDKSKTQTTTVTVTNQYTAGMEMAFEIAYEKRNTTVTWTVQLNFSYTRTEGLEMSKTETTAIGISQTFTVPAFSTYIAEMTVAMGTLPANTTYRTNGKRWYDQQLDHSTYDPDNGWYMRDEIVTFDMHGTVAVKTTLDVDTKPFDPNDIESKPLESTPL